MPNETPQEQTPKTPPTGIPPVKKQTARISLDATVTPTDPRRATSPMDGADGPIPQTIKLKKPSTSPLFVKPPSTGPITPVNNDDEDLKTSTTVLRELTPGRDVTSSKRETSRIVLKTAPPPHKPSAPATDAKQATAPITGIPVSATGIPQTIRLRRPPTSSLSVKPVDLSPTATTRARRTPPATDAKQATAPMSEAPTVPRPVGAGRQKSETSRIVLDDTALARADDPRRATAPVSTPKQPQTIRLKRPSDSLTVKPDTPDESESAKSQTAKIDLPSLGEQDSGATSSITQRKTIKIKRTERNVTPRTLVLKRSDKAPKKEPGKAEKSDEKPAGKPAATPEKPAPAPEPAESTAVEWMFTAAAAAALICAAMLAYLLAAQAFGPELQLPVPANLL